MRPGAKSAGKETAMQYNGKFNFGNHSEGDEPFLTILTDPKPVDPKESEID